MHAYLQGPAWAFVISSIVTPAVADEATVVVTATRQAMRSNELLSDVSVITRAEIDLAGQTTVEQLLASQPGIEYAANGGPGTTSGIFIRGASSKQTIVLIDGQRVGSASSGDVAFSRIPLSQVERIEILRGPASSLYGADAIGGVIQIFTRRGEGRLRLNASIGYGTYDTAESGAGFTGGNEAISYSLQIGHYKTTGFNAISNSAKSSYNPDRDGYRNTNYSGSFAFRPAQGHEIGLNLLHSSGISKYDSTPKARDFANDQDLGTYSIYSRNRLGETWISTLRLGRSKDDSTNLRNDAVISIFRTDQDQATWQNDIRLPLGRAMLAAEYLRQRLSGTTAYLVTERSIRSLLAGWNGNLGDHRLQFNLRRDENSQFGGKSTGFVAYGYQFDPDWRAHLSYGTAFRAPSFNELYYPNTGFGGGNPNLKPETSRNREIGLDWERGAHRFFALYFNNKVSGLIAGWPPVNVSNATLSGTSLGYEGGFSDWLFGITADFQRPRDDDTGKRLVRRADEQMKIRLSRDYGNWHFGGEWQLVGKRYEDAANNRKLGGYGLVNLFADYRLDRDWTLFARGNNVFNKNYELALDYATLRASVFAGVRYAPK